MNEKAKHILFAVCYIVLGTLIGVALILLLPGSKTLTVIREINDHYATVLGTAFAFLLIVVTSIYVVLTYLQVRASKESVKLNHEFLIQAQKQLLHSRIPVLVATMVESGSAACSGQERRQLGVDWALSNIGDGPALQIHTRMKLRFSHAEFKDFDELHEYSFQGNLAPNQEKRNHLHFETEKITKLFEDFSIAAAKNKARVKLYPRQSPYPGPELHLHLVYSNMHGQFFKTEMAFPILCLRAMARKDKKDQMVYFWSENPIRDDENFELVLMNPIFSRFTFRAIQTEEAQAFVDTYRALL